MWLAAAMAVIAFMIRPFGGMAIAGCVGAILLYDARMPRTDRWDRRAPDQVDQDGGAVRCGAGGLRRAMALADGVWPEAMGFADQRESFPVPFPGAARELPPRGRARAGALPGHGVVAARTHADRDAAMAPCRDRQRGNFRVRTDPDADGPFTAGSRPSTVASADGTTC